MREILFRGFYPCDGPETVVVDGEKVKGMQVFEPGKIPYCSKCKEYSDDGDKGATICPWCGIKEDSL